MKTEEKTIMSFIVQATDKTPAVSFVPENLYFNISGIATSHQTAELFSNAGKWITEYDKQLDLREQENKHKGLNLTFEFNFLQADNASLEAIKGLLARIERMNSRTVYVIIKWHYNSAGEKMKTFMQQYIDGYRIFFETINEMGVPSFFIHPTDVSPKIFFDAPNRTFRISGSSRPEQVDAFYSQIENWIKHNGQKWMCGHPLDIKMRYFNTSSAKSLMEIIKLVDKLHTRGKPGTINWHYETEDELEEVKEEFVPNVQNLIFNYLLRKQEFDSLQ